MMGTVHGDDNLVINEQEDENIYTYNSEKKKNKRKCILEMNKMWDKKSRCNCTPSLEMAIYIT